ncbi:MAG: hypothetical protein U0228_34665 [Myxococcaceae bacterium]
MSGLLLVVLLAFDGGTVALLDAGVRALTAEDQEVVDNLELLQNLDSAADLELLQELSVER